MAHLYDRDWTQRELLRYVGRMEQVAGIRPVEAGDGMARGGRALEVWTGTGLIFHVLADRGLDISTCRYQGISMAWNSSVGEVHPSYYEPAGLGWLRSFQGGLFVTGGLDQYGSPSEDAGEALGLHGRASNLPARCVNCRTSWAGDEYVLEVSGEVRQTRVHGENLVLRRCISTRLGSNRIEIEDEVSNEGFAPHPHMMLYHFNLGFPLLSEKSELHLESEQTVARDAHAETGIAAWKNLQPPTAGYSEQVFRHVPQADSDGKVRVELRNPSLRTSSSPPQGDRGALGLRLTYDRSDLPYLFQWKMMGQGTYVLGIEPGTCGTIEGRAQAREDGGLILLAPGESRSYRLEVEVVVYREGEI